jgi:hypothetical protein
MKTNIFIITIGFLLSICSCNSDTIEKQDNLNLDGELSAVVTRAMTSEIPEQEKEPIEPGGGESPKEPESSFEEKVAFIGDDIKSFNIKTREIVFNNLTADELIKRVGVSSELTFYFDGKKLFESTTIEVGYSSQIIDDLVFFISDSKFYLIDGYPIIQDSWPQDDIKRMKEARDNKSKSREKEWDTFIKYINNKGKIIK